ncbi:MAG TPA: archaellum operon transcriptional activator EarA family protein [Candidatus Thermoplasmatota archaeon]|nr:archaellum operon transcriptional activator EarA family protein [Candidatus Thermoplasmatota archaeon]
MAPRSPEAEEARNDRARFSLAVYALRRSNARRRVLRFLAREGSSYPSFIARNMGLDLPATLGALRGLGERYTADLSLVGLQLVQEVEPVSRGSRTKVYEITDAGRAFWRAYAEIYRSDSE